MGIGTAIVLSVSILALAMIGVAIIIHNATKRTQKDFFDHLDKSFHDK